MSTTTNPNDGRIASLGPTDPLEQYDFMTVLTATNQNPSGLTLGELHATRTYRTVKNVTAVWPGHSDLANLIRQFIHRPVVIKGEDPEQAEQDGVDISVVFKRDTAGRLHPVDIRLANVSVSRFKIKPGFWKINERLEQLLTSQTAGVVSNQIPYRGRKRGSDSPLCSE